MVISQKNGQNLTEIIMLIISRVQFGYFTDKWPKFERHYNANYIEGTVWLFIKEITIGGGDRSRTCDLRRARPSLSQLSYTPNWMKQ